MVDVNSKCHRYNGFNLHKRPSFRHRCADEQLALTLCEMIVLNELSSLRRWFRGDALLQFKKPKNKQTIKLRSFKEESNIICKFFPRSLYSCIIHAVQ